MQAICLRQAVEAVSDHPSAGDLPPCADAIDDYRNFEWYDNHILTKMIEEDLEFDEVLKDAQQKGYAERNPEADVEGHDARCKIAILSSCLWKTLDFTDIYTEWHRKKNFFCRDHLCVPMKKTIWLLASQSNDG